MTSIDLVADVPRVRALPDRASRGDGFASRVGLGNGEAIGLFYLALPTAFFLGGWIVQPLGSLAAVAFAVAVWSAAKRHSGPSLTALGAPRWTLIALASLAWCLLGGQGHFFFANSDWWVRDAVLRDLVVLPWPVRYHESNADLILRTPLGYYLPAAAIGKWVGLRGAELFLALWTVIGVAITFGFMLQDRPSGRVACVRILVFVFFSGMDIIPTLVRGYPHGAGAMIEWWQRHIMYGSSTTQLFWAPNHTLPGWIVAAWIVSRDPRRITVPVTVLFLTLTVFWAPLTAIGIVPLALAALATRASREGVAVVLREGVDWRPLLPVALCVGLVFPYLVAGSEAIPIGLMAHLPWVGEEYPLRHLEFAIVEFACIATLLVMRDRRDPLLWAAIVMLALLPVVYFGPYNDLAMRGSVPALALMAILAGRWLSSPWSLRDAGGRLLLVALLAVGAVTPSMEFARAIRETPWPLREGASLIEVTDGAHYFTSTDRPWLRRFIDTPGALGGVADAKRDERVVR